MYTIAYPFDGRRRRQMRREFDTAFSLAKEIALKMADGALNVLTLEGRERFVYERALELSTSIQMDLDVLVSRAVEAANIAGGPDQLVEAARMYEVQRRGIVHKMVPEVVTELIDNRRASEASALYLRDLRVRLENRFAAAFKVPISSVTTGDIQRFLDGLKCKPRTKKNFLTTIGTLPDGLRERIAAVRLTPANQSFPRCKQPIFHIFTALAEFERDLIRERTKAGLTAARARGRKGGRRPIPPEHPSVVAAKKMHGDKTMPVSDICRTLRISRPTLYRYLALK
jgi:hypothetical protein